MTYILQKIFQAVFMYEKRYRSNLEYFSDFGPDHLNNYILSIYCEELKNL